MWVLMMMLMVLLLGLDVQRAGPCAIELLSGALFRLDWAHLASANGWWCSCWLLDDASMVSSWQRIMHWCGCMLRGGKLDSCRSATVDSCQTRLLLAISRLAYYLQDSRRLW